MNQVSTTVTAVITSLAALPAQMIVAWAAKNGYTLPPGYDQAAAMGIALLLGMASQRLAVVNQAFDDLVGAGTAALVKRWNKESTLPTQAGFARLGVLMLLVALSASVALLGGCGWMSAKSAIVDAPQIQSLPPLGQKVQRTVDAGNAALAVVYTFVRDGLKAKTLAGPDAARILAKADEFSGDLDKAQDLINAGGFDAAQAKAASTQALIKILHDEALAAAQKRSAVLVPSLTGA